MHRAGAAAPARHPSSSLGLRAEAARLVHGQPRIRPRRAHPLRDRAERRALAALAYDGGVFKPQPVIDHLRALTASIDSFTVLPRLVVSTFADVGRRDGAGCRRPRPSGAERARRPSRTTARRDHGSAREVRRPPAPTSGRRHPTRSCWTRMPSRRRCSRGSPRVTRSPSTRCRARAAPRPSSTPSARSSATASACSSSAPAAPRSRASGTASPGSGFRAWRCRRAICSAT